ncbi:MAG: hypothetical protein OXU81_00505 [Gammaproteobacteria bacterium]|nr:hypothetical protein [Gammaproteobacteria bacterium]
MVAPCGFGNVRRLDDDAPAIVDGYVYVVGRLFEADDLAGARQVCQPVEPLKAPRAGGAVLLMLRMMKSIRQKEETETLISGKGNTVAYGRIGLAAQDIPD